MDKEQWEQAVGLAVIAAIGGMFWLVGTFWYVLIPAGIGLVAFIGYRNSPATKEQQARTLNDQLYQDALARLQPGEGERGEVGFAQRILSEVPNLDDVPDDVRQALINCCFALYALEPFEPQDIPKPPPLANSMEGARYRDRINSLVQKFDSGSARRAAEDAIARAFWIFIKTLPPLSSRGDLLAEVPLSQLGNAGEAIHRLSAGLFHASIIEHRLFDGLREQLNRNAYAVSGYDFDKDTPRDDQLTFADTYKGGEDIAQVYLRQTPLLPILQARVPFRIPEHLRYEHTAIVGGSGHGKTSLLQHMILADLQKAANGGGGFAVIDPKGTLIDLIARQACFAPGEGALADRILLIDPKRDIAFPPALNMFDLGIGDAALDEAERMSVRNNALALIEYMFSDLLGVGTTGRQGVSFKYIGDLMLEIPGANIMTLLDFLEHPERYAQYLARLDETTRTYLQNQFLSQRFDTTRNGLAERVYAVLQLPMMKAMFASAKTKVNVGDAINRGKIILIKADESFLTTEGCSLFGGVWIALLFQAALARAAIPREQRRGFTLYIDEASMFFSDRLRQLLIKAREYRIGAVFAFQDLEQIESRQVRASVMGSTSTKLVGGLNAHDRHAFAAEMNCSEAFLQTPRKDESRRQTQFAGFVRGVTETPMLLTFPLGALDRTPTMSAEAFERLIEHNRRQVSNRFDPPPATAQEAPRPPPDAERESAPETAQDTPSATQGPAADDAKPGKRQSRYRSMDYTPRDDHED